MIEDIVETVSTKSQVEYTSTDMELELGVRHSKLVLLVKNL